MRLLHRLDGRVAIWPMDPLPRQGSAVSRSTPASICGAPAFRNEAPVAGRAQVALKVLGSAPARLRFEPNDHQTDALVTAAGMRALASSEPIAFTPLGLTPALARTEGWTFGVL